MVKSLGELLLSQCGSKVVDLLEENEWLRGHARHKPYAVILTQFRTRQFTWHDVVIPASEA